MNTRQINILRDLLSSNDYITGKELSEKYGVSTKTAYTDLSDINEELKAFHVEIERKPRLGIRLDINRDKKSKVLQFIEQSHNEQFDEASIFRRDCEILQKLILGSGKIDVIDWSTTHFISEASIRRDLDRLEKQLASYRISLVRKSGQVFLKAKEENIRKFFRNYLIQHFDLSYSDVEDGSLDVFFHREEIQSVIENVRISSNHYHFKTAEQYSIYLVLDLLIGCRRFLAGHILSEESSTVMVENLTQYEVYVIAGELFYKISGVSMQLIPDSEIRAICYTLLSVGYETQLVKRSGIEPLALRFVERVSALSSVDFT